MAWRRSRVRIPYAPLAKKQGNPPGMASTPAFYAFQPSFLPLLAQHMPHLSQKSCHGSRHKISEASPGFPRSIFSDAPYLDIFRPGIFLKRRLRLTEQLIKRNLFLKAIDHRQNVSRILREHGAGGIRHGRAENPLVIR